jgi:hypothetical protein
MTKRPTEEVTDHEDPEVHDARMALAVEALPFTQISVENADELRRQWIIKECFHPETPMNKATIQFYEDLFQWQKNGMQEPKVKVVK